SPTDRPKRRRTFDFLNNVSTTPQRQRQPLPNDLSESLLAMRTERFAQLPHMLRLAGFLRAARLTCQRDARRWPPRPSWHSLTMQTLTSIRRTLELMRYWQHT